MNKTYIILAICILVFLAIGIDYYHNSPQDKSSYNNLVTHLTLPVMSLDLGNERIEDITRETYIPIDLHLTGTNSDFALSGVSAELRGRGNGSRTFAKKGYRIKFEDKQGLFGLEPNKHRALVAANQDRSLVKNNLAYTIVNKNLNNIEYTTPAYFVELFINQQYWGVYSLFEHIRVDKGRVDIESNFDDPDTGYLLEYDSYIINEGTENIDYFTVPGLKYPFGIKSPDPDDHLKESTAQAYAQQVAFITSYVTDTVQSALDHDFETFTQLADVPSFVDMYIIHELMKNTDTGRSSFYLYKKPGGKLYAGPAWDFDSSAGSTNSEASYTGLYVGDTIQDFSPETSSELYIALMQQPQFIALVKTRLQEITPDLFLTVRHFFDEIAQYDDAFQRDSLRWTAESNAYKQYQEDLQHRLIQRLTRLHQWATNEPI